MIDPKNNKSAEPSPDAAPVDADRRAALRLGLLAGAGLLLGGCASGGSNRVSDDTPGLKWPGSRPDSANMPKQTTADTRRVWKRPEPWAGPTPAPDVPRSVTSRNAWANAAPIPARMDRMLPPKRITIHHDGMDPVTMHSKADVAHRLDQIRRSHLRQNFGDIGYHYIIDPMGRVWEGRPLTWQGAHVANQNPHNIGVMCLGNFEIERPTSAQLDSLDRFTSQLMRMYRIPVREVKTHRELASTLCPGKNLQPHINRARRGALAMVG